MSTHHFMLSFILYVFMMCLMTQISRAVAVLYARQLLMSLLADWPMAGHVISADLLCCSAAEHLPYVLDLLNRSQPPELFSKVCFASQKLIVSHYCVHLRVKSIR